MDNLADKYYELVFTGSNPVEALVFLYCELFDKEESLSIRRKFLKYVKLFGVRRVYFALFIMSLNLVEVSDNVNIATRYLEKILLSDTYKEFFSTVQVTSSDLTSYVEEQGNMLTNKERFDLE